MTTPRIVALTGVARSGKDTVAGFMNSFSYQRVAFADAVKEMVLALDPIIDGEVEDCRFGDNERDHQKVGFRRLQHYVAAGGMEKAKEHPEVRRLLQRMGTEAGREVLGKNIWIDVARTKITSVLAGNGRVVVTDCRFVNEAEAIRKMGGVIWKLERPGAGIGTHHASEQQIGAIRADWVVLNNTTLDALRQAVQDKLSSEYLMSGS